MNTTTLAVATGVIVAAGRWAQEKPVDVKIAIGAGAFAISLALIAQVDKKIAGQFAFMVFFLASIMYLPALVNKLGWGGPYLTASLTERTRATGAPGTR